MLLLESSLKQHIPIEIYGNIKGYAIMAGGSREIYFDDSENPVVCIKFKRLHEKEKKRTPRRSVR